MPSCIAAGGAGGKGTWGKLVEVYDDDCHTHDQRDPNYDSEEEVVRHTHTCTHTHSYNMVTYSYQETYTVSPSSPHLSVEDFRKQAVGIFKEYFEHGDTVDVTVSEHYMYRLYIVAVK